MEKTYDLTKSEVLNTVLQGLMPKDNYDKVLLLNPYAYLAKKGLEYIFNSNTATKQAEAAKSLIIQGKQAGVDEMEIKLNNSKGFKLDVPLEEAQIDTIIGSNETMTLKVKYK